MRSILRNTPTNDDFQENVYDVYIYYFYFSFL